MANDQRREPPGWLAGLIRVDDAVAKVEGVVVVASLAVMLLLYFLYVVFRNVSASLGEKWLAEVPLQVVLWVSLFGGALAARQGRHIAIDIAPRVLPKKALRIVRLFTNTAAVVMAAILAFAGWRYLFRVELAEGTLASYLEITFGQTTLLKIPSWVFIAVTPIGFALTAWHFLVLGLRDVMGFPPLEEVGEEDVAPTPTRLEDEGDFHPLGGPDLDRRGHRADAAEPGKEERP